MLVEVRLMYDRFFYCLVFFPLRWWTWREAFQKKYGNIYDMNPIGANVVRFPKHFHSFHILGPSPWPICVSMSLLIIVSGLLDFLNVEQYWVFSLFLGLSELVVCLWCWWEDVVTESLTEHTKQIKYGIAVGMVLFIISEIMFFFSFFWAFFHVSLAPAIELGCVWPPKGLETLVISPWGAPLLNTIILLSSGVTVTCAHYAFLAYCYKQRKLANFLNAFAEYLSLVSVAYTLKLSILEGKDWWLIRSRHVSMVIGICLEKIFSTIKHKFFYKILFNNLLSFNFIACFNYFSYTLILAIFFTVSQGLEYLESPICISDGVYGSTFFVMTGFHGFHVIVGTIFLLVCFLRILFHRYSFVYFIGLECAIWYWHFVDVVWLFLFLFVYYWGNAMIPIIDFDVFGANISADFASKFQLDFQDSASVLMESIVDLHNYIMFYLWVILGMVTWMLFAFVVGTPTSRFRSTILLIKLLAFDMKQREIISRRLFFIFNEDMKKRTNKFFGYMRDIDLAPNWRSVFGKIEADVKRKREKDKRRKYDN